MNCSRMLAAIGLALDLSGALLLWKYGLPESLRETLENPGFPRENGVVIAGQV